EREVVLVRHASPPLTCGFGVCGRIRRRRRRLLWKVWGLLAVRLGPGDYLVASPDGAHRQPGERLGEVGSRHDLIDALAGDTEHLADLVRSDDRRCGGCHIVKYLLDG